MVAMGQLKIGICFAKKKFNKTWTLIWVMHGQVGLWIAWIYQFYISKIEVWSKLLLTDILRF
jgi:hypothetical protein